MPLRIHISETTYQLLKAAGKYLLEERGTIEVKGKVSAQAGTATF
jgi:hypothetical protein